MIRTFSRGFKNLRMRTKTIEGSMFKTHRKDYVDTALKEGQSRIYNAPSNNIHKYTMLISILEQTTRAKYCII